MFAFEYECDEHKKNIAIFCFLLHVFVFVFFEWIQCVCVCVCEPFSFGRSFSYLFLFFFCIITSFVSSPCRISIAMAQGWYHVLCYAYSVCLGICCSEHAIRKHSRCFGWTIFFLLRYSADAAAATRDRKCETGTGAGQRGQQQKCNKRKYERMFVCDDEFLFVRMPVWLKFIIGIAIAANVWRHTTIVHLLLARDNFRFCFFFFFWRPNDGFI